MSSARPIHFGQHALAVLAAATLGTATVTVCWTVGLAVAISSRPLGAPILTLALVCWLGIMLIALPSTAIVLSLLWPISRRGTTASRWICLLAGIATGIAVAPMWSPQMRGFAPSELPIFALSGALIAGIYILAIRWLGKELPLDTEAFA